MTFQQSEPQEMPAPQPVVLLVNHAVDPSQGCYTRHPYLNRGAQFSNGCRCFLPQIIMLCVLGSILIFIGFCIVVLGIPSGILFLAVGGILLGLGLYIIRTAKRQFNSLPADHPDRVKYAARNITAGGPGQSPTMYTMPPMQNQVMSYPSPNGGQVYLLPVPPGSFVPTSSGVDGGQVQYVLTSGPGYSSMSPGSSAPRGTYVPENDPPPAYADVVHNT